MRPKASLGHLRPQWAGSAAAAPTTLGNRFGAPSKFVTVFASARRVDICVQFEPTAQTVPRGVFCASPARPQRSPPSPPSAAAPLYAFVQFPYRLLLICPCAGGRGGPGRPGKVRPRPTRELAAQASGLPCSALRAEQAPCPRYTVTGGCRSAFARPPVSRGAAPRNRVVKRRSRDAGDLSKIKRPSVTVVRRDGQKAIPPKLLRDDARCLARQPVSCVA